MKHYFSGILLFLSFALLSSEACAAHTIKWEATDRFRFFTDTNDFRKFVEAYDKFKSTRDPVLAVERELAKNNGHGWAREMLERTCWHRTFERLQEGCTRNKVYESYLNPIAVPVEVWVKDSPETAGRTCEWTLPSAKASKPAVRTQPCCDRVRLSLRAQGNDKVFKAAIFVRIADSTETPTTQTITVRHLHIAGIGDSIASGEGNPDKPVQMGNRAVCYPRSAALHLGDAPNGERVRQWRPARAPQKTQLDCHTDKDGQRAAWNSASALWLSPACHRSLYSNQMRSALQLAAQHQDIVVTYIPLGCTGATIYEGLLGEKPARETYCYRNDNGRRICNDKVRPQVTVLKELARKITRPANAPAFDAILLTVGANDIGFSGLVASVLLNPLAERDLKKYGFFFKSTATARQDMKLLPARFQNLAGELRPLVGQDLKRVFYVMYPNPASAARNTACGAGRRGLDIHPQMSTDAAELQDAWMMTEKQFFPLLRRLAQCPLGGKICDNAFTLVDKHQDQFDTRGYCATSAADPDFDRKCFTASGDSFYTKRKNDGTDDNLGTLRCNLSAANYRAYASRQRWIRTPNDSYFAANTFPDSPPTLYIGDPWNLLLASTYGGAIHPTAEAHAAIADAIVPRLMDKLGLKKPE